MTQQMFRTAIPHKMFGGNQGNPILCRMADIDEIDRHAKHDIQCIV